MAIKFPSQEQTDQAQSRLEALARIDRYIEMIEAGQGTAELLYNLGVAYLEVGEWDEAQRAFEESVRHDPRLLQGYVNLGAVHFQQGRLDEAVTNMRKALELQDDFLPARSNLGITLMKMGRHQEAIKELEIVHEAEPKYPAALGALAMCYKAVGDEDKAEALRKKAEEMGVRFSTPDEEQK